MRLMVAANEMGLANIVRKGRSPIERCCVIIPRSEAAPASGVDEQCKHGVEPPRNNYTKLLTHRNNNLNIQTC